MRLAEQHNPNWSLETPPIITSRVSHLVTCGTGLGSRKRFPGDNSHSSTPDPEWHIRNPADHISDRGSPPFPGPARTWQCMSGQPWKDQVTSEGSLITDHSFTSSSWLTTNLLMAVWSYNGLTYDPDSMFWHMPPTAWTGPALFSVLRVLFLGWTTIYIYFVLF